MPYDPDKFAAVVNAELPLYRWTDDRMVSGALQKAMLLVVLAFEGERVSVAAYASRAGTSDGSAYRALGALVLHGVLVVTSEHGGGGFRTVARTYRISVQRLHELRSTIDLDAHSKVRRRGYGRELTTTASAGAPA